MKFKPPGKVHARVTKCSVKGTSDLTTVVELEIPLDDRLHLFFTKSKSRVVEIAGAFRVMDEKELRNQLGLFGEGPGDKPKKSLADLPSKKKGKKSAKKGSKKTTKKKGSKKKVK